MKKLLSLLMSLVMLVSCFSFNAVAKADELDDFINGVMELYKSAVTLQWDSKTKSGTCPVSINSQATTMKEYFCLVKFEPTTTRWYEFSLDKVPEVGLISFTVESEDFDEEIYAKEASAGATFYSKEPESNLKTGAKLTAGNTYYIIVMGSETGVYSANLKVTTHTHTYGNIETEEAYYEYYAEIDEVFSYDGGKFQTCTGCAYEKTIETYYRPKTLTLSYTSCVYNAKQKKPTVTVKDRKGNKISSANYRVKYSNNIKPGKATVTVTFKGSKYSGSMTKTFIIKPKKITLSSVTSPKSKKLVVKWKKGANVSGYQIAYSTSTKFTKSTTKYVTVSNAKTVQKTITGLKGGKKYSVKVRAYKTVDGKKKYGSWSSYKTVKVKK
ncbi:MAG: fibronectin type III domain-containing protein [Eubacterium sp.]|nr:fibronectin type III domain-containing protein [Eubacterium sp.]